MKLNLYRRTVGLVVTILLLGMMVTVVPAFAAPHGIVVREKVKKKKERRQVPESDMLSMLGLSLGVLSCAVVARRRAVSL